MKLFAKLANGKKIYNTYAASQSQCTILEGEELRSLQNCIFGMYQDVQAVCEKYNIQLFGVGGTALGAVRHQGFIPWDDDVDCAMTREDFKKFTEIFDAELSDKYILNAPNISSNPITRFPKIQKKGTKCVSIGDDDSDENMIDIDIFLIEHVPQNKLARIIKGLRCNSAMFISSQVFCFENWKCRKDIYLIGGKAYAYFRYIIGMIFSYRKYTKWLNKIDKQVQYGKSTNLCAFPTGAKHYFGEIHNTDIILPAKKVPFENGYIYLLNNIDAYLTNLYGDYMKIPPEEKRMKHYVKNLKIN